MSMKLLIRGHYWLSYYLSSLKFMELRVMLILFEYLFGISFAQGLSFKGELDT